MTSLWVTASDKRGLLLIVIGFVALALGFSAGPIFEGPDEIEHYRYVRTLRDTLALPNPAGQIHGQYHQPPLYYLLLLPIAEILPDGDFERIDGALNPFYGRQIDLPGNDNTNLYLHSRAENFPYPSETARAVHAMRLLSIVLGAATVLTAYHIYALLWAERGRRLAATAISAFLPQFIYISSVLNNDNLLILLATLSLYLVLRQIKRGATWRSSILLGMVLGAIALTKVSGLPLIALIGLFFAVQPRLWRYGVVVGTVGLAVGGWWYLHNGLLYGDPAGMRALFTTWAEERIGPGIALDVGLGRLQWTYQTVYARFGAGAVAVGAWLAAFFNVIIGLTLVGWLARAWRWARARRQITAEVVVVAAFAAVWVANVVYYASTAWSGNQGRYLLPGIAAWAALIVLGLDTLTPRRFRGAARSVLCALWAGAAVVCLVVYFLPAYQARPLAQTIEHPLRLRYGDTAELIGISTPVLRARPGENVTVALYWRALNPSKTPLYSYLHSDSDQAMLVRIDSVPGNGHLLSTEFETGQTWTELYTVTIPADAEPQRVHPLLAGLYDAATHEVIAAANDGNDVLPQVGNLAIVGTVEAGQPVYRLGERIGLETPQITMQAEAMNICLTWDALADGDGDYQVFVHLIGADGQMIAQGDHTPSIGGRAYPTFAWAAGERIEDCFALPLDAQSASLEMGMYDRLTNTRLAVVDGDSKRVADDVIRVALK